MEKIPLYKHQAIIDTSQNPSLSTWRTGFWRRFPHTGVLALVVSILASASMIYIIRTSDGQPISSWTYQPTVWLAVSYTIANIALQYALARAVTIAWWTKALKGDAKVKDLHNIWAFGHGFCDILLSGRSFNLVALAGLVVTLAPINGPLLQRASIVHERTRVDMNTINMSIAEVFPDGYTGETAGHGGETPSSLSASFSDIMKQYTTRQPINISSSGCVGTCKGIVYGAGYDVTCSKDTTDPYHISLNMSEYGGRAIGFSFFWSNFTYMEERLVPNTTTAVMNFTAVFKGESTCTGELNRTHCVLHPATIGYPIVMTNNTIDLDPDGSWETDQAYDLHPPWLQTYRGPTTHGGMYLYANELYKSHMDTRWDGIAGWHGWTTGTTGYRYMVNLGNINNSSMIGGCVMQFVDPTSDILSTVREIAFRTALYIPGDAAVTATRSLTDTDTDTEGVRLGRFGAYGEPSMNASLRESTYRRAVTIQQTRVEIVFKSQYQYLAIAVSITLAATCCVLVVLAGWWRLGREVSLSPVEIARAFNAELLADSQPNADADALLKSCGSKAVRYGAVWGDVGQGEHPMPMLRFEETERCEKPKQGQVFGD
ncbi:hypothetical protein BDW02DRAFT_569704 [Decorospora gaudefroyi]|uniref:Uncharacterized protein n=1 Tax=Decorospora gaudefroyi TaxID=184978 RepID=A0A6A5KJU5_9PLEO|nr:hypothetical protein BDW02DRAFT_569704 [Decorospora gaudefroyi]